MRGVVVMAILVALGTASQVVWAQDCAGRVGEARAAVKQAESALANAKESGRKAAATPLAKARKLLLHAEAECKTAGSDVRKLAESGREAREAQGFAEEAAALAEKL